jgi:hypothetical protein
VAAGGRGDVQQDGKGILGHVLGVEHGDVGDIPAEGDFSVVQVLGL